MSKLEQIIFLVDKGRVSWEVLEEILKGGGVIEDDEPLAFAATIGNLCILQLLMKHADHIDNLDAVFGVAAREGFLHIVEFLERDPRVDIHAANDLAFRFACLCGHLEVVKWLCDHGADVHALDDDALNAASQNQHLDVVNLLLEKGAQFDHS